MKIKIKLKMILINKFDFSLKLKLNFVYLLSTLAYLLTSIQTYSIDYLKNIHLPSQNQSSQQALQHLFLFTFKNKIFFFF